MNASLISYACAGASGFFATVTVWACWRLLTDFRASRGPRPLPKPVSVLPPGLTRNCGKAADPIAVIRPAPYDWETEHD